MGAARSRHAQGIFTRAKPGAQDDLAAVSNRIGWKAADVSREISKQRSTGTLGKAGKEDPSLAAAAERELDWLDRYEIDAKLENRGRYDEFDLDRLTDGLERIEREDRRLIDQVTREADREHQERLRETLGHEKSDERDRQKWDLDDLLGPRHQRKDKEQEREQESTVGPSWETFERDRQQQDQMERKTSVRKTANETTISSADKRNCMAGICASA